jgi:parallel beta-helix repeat protein
MLIRFLGRLVGRPSRKLRSSRPRLEALEDRSVPAVLNVGPGDHFKTISAAIAQAHKNDIILVDPGTYTEQLSITGHTRDGLKIVAEDPDDPTVIKAPTGLNGSIVDIENVSDVLFQGFTVTGNGNAAGTIDSAVRVDTGASATIRDNHITGLFNGTNNQAGDGIRVGDAVNSTVGTATIVDNVIDGYQKDGIIVSGAGSSATIRDNVVKGAGPVGLVAQNGIQVSDGAAGKVIDNSVTGNVYTGNDFLADGILVFNDTAKVVVRDNRVTHNESGVVLDSVSNVVVADNTVSSNTLDGIDVFSATSSSLVGNRADHNGSAGVGDGIHVETSSSLIIQSNEASNNAGNGIYLLQSDGNMIRDNEAVSNAGDGLTLQESNNNSVIGNTFRKNMGQNIDQIDSNSNTFKDNNGHDHDHDHDDHDDRH